MKLYSQNQNDAAAPWLTVRMRVEMPDARYNLRAACATLRALTVGGTAWVYCTAHGWQPPRHAIDY